MPEITHIVKGMVQSDVKLNGKTVIVTGCNTGIGLETVIDLAKRGAKVVMACRNLERAEEAKKKVLEQVDGANVVVKKLDLASLASVREFAMNINKTEQRLDILINNAGVMMCPPWKTEDGFEMQFGTNHLGHFLLTNLLLNLLKKSAPSRIVIVASLAHEVTGMHWDDIMFEKKYHAVNVYGQSKLANVLHCKELARRLEGTGVTCYSLHPGVVDTDLMRHMEEVHNYIPLGWRCLFCCLHPCSRLTSITPIAGAQTTLYCALAPELATVSGRYYSDCAEKRPSANAQKMEDAERLWKLSEELTKEK